MPEWTKPEPPYALDMPPQWADTPYDDLPAAQQERLDRVRIDTSLPIPPPQPDVLHPTPPAEQTDQIIDDVPDEKPEPAPKSK